MPLLERSQDPRIVKVGSGLGSFGLFRDEGRIESRAGTPLYGAAKAAINMLTARYAKLLPGIRINVAEPRHDRHRPQRRARPPGPRRD